MTDRELIELAAKAAGIKLFVWGAKGAENFAMMPWNPLENDADAFRLAVKLGILVLTARGFAAANSRDSGGGVVRIPSDNDPYAATRRAITRAAAEIAKERFR